MGIAAARWCDQAVEINDPPPPVHIPNGLGGTSHTTPSKTFPKDRRDSPRSCSPTASTRVGTPKTLRSEASPSTGNITNTIHELLALVGTEHAAAAAVAGTNAAGTNTTTTSTTTAGTAAAAANTTAAAVTAAAAAAAATNPSFSEAYAAYAAAAGLFYPHPPVPPRALDWQAQWAAASQYYWTLPSVDDVKSNTTGGSTAGAPASTAVSAVY